MYNKKSSKDTDTTQSTEVALCNTVHEKPYGLEQVLLRLVFSNKFGFEFNWNAFLQIVRHQVCVI